MYIILTSNQRSRVTSASYTSSFASFLINVHMTLHGQCKYMGFVVAFGAYKVYHSGDTLWYDGMVEILKPFEVDVAFLPINGNKPERKVAGNLNVEEAAQLGKAIGAKLVIPHHYDLFAFNTEDPANFVAAAQHTATPHRVMQLGEGISYPVI